MIFVIILSLTAVFSQPTQLKTYGYFDLEAEISNKDAAGERGTFDQHHFNMISIYQLDEHFRVFGEIEFEHGAAIEGDSEGKTTGHGEVVVERVWLEYKHSDLLKAKLGKFLPPFGIYNLKHDATPTFLPVTLPGSLYGKHENTVGGEQRLFAKYATGIQLLGSLFLNEWEANYFLYVTNGRGPEPDSKDNNSNKALGGRFAVIHPFLGFNLGTSFYSDVNGNAKNTKQSTLAFDVILEHSNFSLESEYFFHQMEEVDIDTVPNGDFRKGTGYYLQGAYTFGDRLTPYVRYDFSNHNAPISNHGETDVVLGVNYSITSRVYLKGEIHDFSYQSSAKKNYQMFATAIAVAF